MYPPYQEWDSLAKELLNVNGDPLSYMLRGSLVLQYSEIVPRVFDEIEKLWLDQFDLVLYFSKV